MEKWGAKFVSPWHAHSAGFQFADAMDPTMPLAYQVRRSEFDEILFRRAARAGATTIENCRVRDVDLGDRGTPPKVNATRLGGETLELRPKFVIDATGPTTAGSGSSR
jgi:flavin-dependent dehydrogenase